MKHRPKSSPRHRTDSQAGNVMVIALVFTLVLSAIALSTLRVVSSSHDSQSERELQERRLSLAEAGLDAAIAELNHGGDGNVGDPQSPMSLGSGEYFTVATPGGVQEFTVHSMGTVKGKSRTVRATVQRRMSPFSAAIFAGNSSGDPTYQLEFGGTGATADTITGDIFSGGDLDVTMDASITGDLYARGTITGATGTEGHDPSNPDIAAMNYEVNHDIDVAAEFAANEVYLADDAGGTAWQLPEEYASHIFRKNPTDRPVEIAGTAKDDYFLEDPYEPIGRDAAWDGTDAFEVTLSGTGGKPGPDANNKVYFVDGNLWIHNLPTYSLKFVHPNGDPIRVTFVVKGNIYIGDNLFYADMAQDGVALIAIKDAGEPDSGNVYFGDPRAGTLETMHSMMYAENDFHENNLDNAGSDRVIVHGCLSAGNQVAIERDFETQRAQLLLTHDTRLAAGELELPGIPRGSAAGRDYRMLMWEVHESWKPNE